MFHQFLLNHSLFTACVTTVIKNEMKIKQFENIFLPSLSLQSKFKTIADRMHADWVVSPFKAMQMT